MAKRIKYALSKSFRNVTDVNVELENGNLWDVDYYRACNVTYKKKIK